MQGRLRKILVLSAILFAALTVRTHANATVYWDFDNGFSPSTVAIAPGEKVTWVNFDIYGFDVQISVTGYFPFTLPPFYSAYAFFDTPGTYNMSSDYGDYGTIIVDLPPSLTITNPVNNAVFSAPATFQLETSASDNIAYMYFMIDSGNGPEFLDYDYEAPFTYGFTNLAAGTYTITATGLTGYNDIADSITITVTDVVPVIALGNARLTAAGFLFDASGLTVGKTHVIQDSVNCTTWNSIATNLASASSMTFTNATATGVRFYRVLQLAAP